MADLAKLPTARASFYTVRKARDGWDVILVTPAGRNPITTRLRRWGDRESAFADAKVTADLAQLPFLDTNRQGHRAA